MVLLVTLFYAYIQPIYVLLECFLGLFTLSISSRDLTPELCEYTCTCTCMYLACTITVEGHDGVFAPSMQGDTNMYIICIHHAVQV